MLYELKIVNSRSSEKIHPQLKLPIFIVTTQTSRMMLERDKASEHCERPPIVNQSAFFPANTLSNAGVLRLTNPFVSRLMNSAAILWVTAYW